MLENEMNIDIKAKRVADFSVEFLQFLDENSQATQDFPDFADPDQLLYLYRQMSLLRQFDNKAINLQRTGKMGTFPSSRGQEAVFIGAGQALQQTDIFCPYYHL